MVKRRRRRRLKEECYLVCKMRKRVTLGVCICLKSVVDLLNSHAYFFSRNKKVILPDFKSKHAHTLTSIMLCSECNIFVLFYAPLHIDIIIIIQNTVQNVCTYVALHSTKPDSAVLLNQSTHL